ncbi:hypothetical protein DPMN_039774 [Dreissena polymorpha]|uniref:Uncharacterized protein n=1 Tax=Dreissena polymorpha TaxID=45954 RepID=A0A9D4CTU6_DREPO|nr:hypothetical protein DPMN_039774 [Dreissena polymorpha]
MQLNKLISLRAALRRRIAKQFEKLEEISSTSESQKLLDIIQEKTHTIRGLNEKIIKHADLGDLETELFDSEEYSIELELKIHRYQEKIKTLNETTFEQKDANQNHFTTASNRVVSRPMKSNVKPLICPFCSEYHQPQVCNKIKDIHQRIDIVKSKRLCFNCLNHHKVSDCKYKFRCRHCKGKHHSSICTKKTTPASSMNPEAIPFKSAMTNSAI